MCTIKCTTSIGNNKENQKNNMNFTDESRSRETFRESQSLFTMEDEIQHGFVGH